MEIIKRIFVIIIWIICFVLMILTVLCQAPIAIFYALPKYIFTGKEDYDTITAPFDWATDLPDKYKKKWKF